MKQLPMTGMPAGFELTERTLEWMALNSPTADVAATLELFCDHAAAKGWMYRDWQAAFRNYVRNGSKYGGVVYRQGRVADPLWTPVLADAKRFGFREPYPTETPSVYKTALMLWRQSAQVSPETSQSNVRRLSDALKSVNAK